MTHGLTEAQFLNTVASFLGPYYIVLALMNGIAALYLWRTGTAKTCFNIRAGEQTFPFTTAIVWLLVSFVFIIMSPLAWSGNGAWMPSMPEWLREAINRGTGPGIRISMLLIYQQRPFSAVRSPAPQGSKGFQA